MELAGRDKFQVWKVGEKDEEKTNEKGNGNTAQRKHHHDIGIMEPTAVS